MKFNFNTFFLPVTLVVLMLSFFSIQYFADISFSSLGVKPRSFEGLAGILFTVFIHADSSHLFSNLFPVLVLSMGLFYLYSPISYKVFSFLFFTTSSIVWIIARDANHIGASGLVYALASFLFFSGIIRRHPQLMAFSLVITFLYGSMVWGIFPDFFPNQPISWESHLAGGISGFVYAVIFRKYGPQKPEVQWTDDDKTENDEIIESNSSISYFYKPNSDNMDTINWQDFEKIEIRVGTIMSVQQFPEARKPAYQISIDFGPLGVKHTSAQITKLYQPEDLKGKQVVAVINFPPKKIANFISECLILGVYKDLDEVVLLHPERKVPNGSKIG